MKPILRPFNTAVCALISVVILLLRWRDWRYASRLVCFPEGGFGHTITIPEIGRRIIEPTPTVFFFSESGRHNKEVAHLWKDVNVIFFPLGRTSYSWGKWGSKRHLPRFIGWLANKINRCGSKDLKQMGLTVEAWNDGSAHPLYEEAMDCRDPESTLRQHPAVLPQHKFMASFFCLLGEKRKLPATMDQGQRERFHSAVQDLWPGQPKLVTVYLRSRAGKAETEARNGSPQAYYYPALEWLTRQEYKILWTGDLQTPDDSLPWVDNVADARKLGLSFDLFNVAAAIECERFIGEAGGGSWLAPLSLKPSLIINAFPFGQAWPNSLLLYKRLYYQGQEVSLDQCLGKWGWTFKFPKGFELRCSTAEEIDMSVREFMETKVELWGSNFEEQQPMPDYHWAHYARARVAKVRLHE